MWKTKFFDLLNQGNPLEAINLKNKNIPTSLFKYQGFVTEHSLKNLENGLIHLRSPDEFNDPYDSSFAINVNELGFKFPKINIENIKDKFSKNDLKLLEQLISGTKPISIRKFNENWKQKTLKIACFSESNDNLLMWSHYANHHKGYCLEYNFNKLENMDLLKRVISPIKYDNNLFNVTNFFTNDDSIMRMLWGFYPSLIKSKDWEYEREWRLIFPHGFLPKGTITYPIPKPTGIYLGTKMISEDKKNLVQKSKELGIQISEMKLDSENFKVYPQMGL